MKILVLHGPNLNLFGRREPHIYGSITLAEVIKKLQALARELKVALDVLQSNHEGALVDFLHQNIDAAEGASSTRPDSRSTACRCTTRSRRCRSR